MVGNDDDDDVDVIGGLRFVALFLGTKNLEGLATFGVVVVVVCRTAAAVSTADCTVLFVVDLLEE
jgi:hypothetical protein